MRKFEIAFRKKTRQADFALSFAAPALGTILNELRPFLRFIIARFSKCLMKF